MHPITSMRAILLWILLIPVFAFAYLIPTFTLQFIGHIWGMVSPTWNWPKSLTDFLNAGITGFLGPVFAIVFGMGMAPAHKKVVGYVLLFLIALIAITTNKDIFAQYAAQRTYNILSLCCTTTALWLFYRRLRQMESEDSYPHNLLYNTTAALVNKPEYPTGGPTTVWQTLSLKGFDPNGEPKIRIMVNGSIYVAFSAMPPLNKKRQPLNLPEFEDFSTALQNAANVTVECQSHNCFFIPYPEKDTAQQLRYYLNTFWKNQR
jgi:hypothetical protein